MTKQADGNNRSQPSAGGVAANNATLTKKPTAAESPPAGCARRQFVGRSGREELQGDNQQRGQHKERRQILLTTAGTLDLHRQGEVQLVVAQQPGAVGENKRDKARLAQRHPPWDSSARCCRCARRRADRKRAPAAPGERFPRRRGRYAESRSAQQPSGHRADNRPSSPHTANSANHSARLRFPLAWLWVPVRASRASIDGKTERRRRRSGRRRG